MISTKQWIFNISLWEKVAHATASTGGLQADLKMGSKAVTAQGQAHVLSWKVTSGEYYYTFTLFLGSSSASAPGCWEIKDTGLSRSSLTSTHLIHEQETPQRSGVQR